MAKKSSKSTRRVRAKKDQTKQTAKKATKTSKPEAVIEPQEVVEAKIEQATPADAQEEAVQDMVQPQRRRMLVSVAALAVVMVALVITAGVIKQQSTNTSNDMVKSGQPSAKADELLQGGKVCTNGPSQTQQGSSNPDSVGMMLQNVPANSVQTPQTFESSNDATTLQGAVCY